LRTRTKGIMSLERPRRLRESAEPTFYSFDANAGQSKNFFKFSRLMLPKSRFRGE